jgi:hypothetical protein
VPDQQRGLHGQRDLADQAVPGGARGGAGRFDRGGRGGQPGSAGAAARTSSSSGSIAFGSRVSTRCTSSTIMFEVPSQIAFSGASR